MTSVRTESSTIRVVALISFVTEMPAKLKKAILTMVPGNGRTKAGQICLCNIEEFDKFRYVDG